MLARDQDHLAPARQIALAAPPARLKERAMLRRWPLLALSLAAFGCATAATVAAPPADPLLSALATEAKNAPKGGFVVAEINGPHATAFRQVC